MDSTHLHLLLNHFPILGTLFGFCLLGFGLIKRNKSIENTGLVTFVIIALITIPAYLTGEGAEETIEHIQGVSENYIHKHEELAETGLWLMSATGGLALLTLVISLIKSNGSRVMKALVLLFAAGTFGLMVVIGNYGGKIRHSELRDQTAIPAGQIDELEKYSIEGDE